VLAEKQKVCPVSGERLGAMDKPVKITVKGQTVFLCCAGCENAIKKDPDKYLAKLKASGAK
jgi:YHS domain-containing protein